MPPCTAAEFVAFPSLKKFWGLGSNKEQKLLDHLGGNISDYEEVLEVYTKVSAVMDENTPEIKESVNQCVDVLFSKLFDSDKCQPQNVANELLVHLGYIKSEDKKFRPVSNPVGILVTLEHAVQQEYFPRSMVNLLTTFLSLPNELVDKYIMPKHNLLQTLYRL